jgi:hypothetical protein
MKSPKRTRRVITLLTILSVLISVSIGAALAVAMNDGVQKLPIKQYFNQSHTNAIWDWSNIRGRSDQDLRHLSDFLYMHQINTVYVDVGALADIQAQANSGERKQQEGAMGKHHIRVLAAAGNTDWSKPDQQPIPLAIQQFVFSYNRSHSAKLAGIEYDIEAYNQTHFAEASFTEKELVLDEYLDLVDLLASQQAQYNQKVKAPLELGFAIPYWFDNENMNIKSVTWHDKTGPVLYHIMDRLQLLPRSNIVVMAYRNAALGNDGMIYHSRTEIDYGRSKAPRVAVLIGMEVNDVEPAKITFYGRSATEIASEVRHLDAEYSNTHAYRGIAINDLAGFEAIGEGK